MMTFICSITGLTPMLMHKWSEESEVEESTRTVHQQKRDPREEAEKVCYRRPDKTLFFPGGAIARMLREAAGSHKQKGSRKSMRYVIPAAVIVMDDDISLLDGDGRKLSTYEVDSRPVVIPATKGRIMRHRPKLNTWGAEFSLMIDETLIDPTFVHQLMTEGGTRLGIMDGRPERGMPFGRFQIVSWKELAKPKPALVPATNGRRRAA